MVRDEVYPTSDHFDNGHFHPEVAIMATFTRQGGRTVGS